MRAPLVGLIAVLMLLACSGASVEPVQPTQVDPAAHATSDILALPIGTLDERQVTTRWRVGQVRSRLLMRRAFYSTFPEDLDSLVQPDKVYGISWLKLEDTRDAFGNKLILVLGDDATDIHVMSLGANGERDGFDAELGLDRDICSDRPLVEAVADR